MSREPILKIIDIDRQLLGQRDVMAVVGFCVDAEADPEQVRMFQGSIGFRFPNHGERGVGLWEDPLIQAWAGELYAHVPHLLYYLDPEPALGALALAVTPRFEPDGIERLAAAAQFARRMADPWEPIVDRLLESLDPRLVAPTRSTVAATLALSRGA